MTTQQFAASILSAIISLSALASCRSYEDGTPNGGIPDPLDLPSECQSSRVDPLTDPECGHAIFEICSRLDNETACNDHDGFRFLERGITIRCGWTEIVTFDRTDTCEKPTYGAVCAAGVLSNEGCIDPCSRDLAAEPDAFQSTPTGKQLRTIGCVLGERLGPIRANADGTPAPITTCEDSGPYACDCADLACKVIAEQKLPAQPKP